MRILLTGANGQLGRAFQECAAGKHEVIPTTHATMPLEDAAAVARAIEEARPEWIVHGAAMTNVDGCERDPAAAYAVNATGTENVARAAARVNARLAYVSTDYVYDGEKGGYIETDATNPISVYGASKLEGERLAQAVLPETLIARTSVVYGPHKKNFVIWVVDELRAGRQIRIVDDQSVTPTLTYDLAEQLLRLIEAGEQGVFHTAGGTSLTRLEMVHAIARAFGLDAGPVVPIKSSDLTWVAKRPRDSTLSTTKVSKYKRPLSLEASLTRLKETLDR